MNKKSKVYELLNTFWIFSVISIPLLNYLNLFGGSISKSAFKVQITTLQ